MRSHALRTVLTATLLIAGTTVITTTPALAGTAVTRDATSWAHTDSAAPDASFVDNGGDAPVGAYTDEDGTTHIAKTYVTFDLSDMRGTNVLRAVLFAGETSVADCDQPRSTELWLTEPADEPSWNNQPAELLKMAGPDRADACPAPELIFTVTTGLQHALAAGRSTATFTLRLPEDQQDDPDRFREYTSAMRLGVTYNHYPAKPAGLTVNNAPCTANPSFVSTSFKLGATLSDPDNSHFIPELVYWPVDHPDQRTTLPRIPSSAKVTADIGRLVERTTYAWQIRTQDESEDYGPWSDICRFTTDYSIPGSSPTIRSAEYNTDTQPGTGGTGVPGTITFDADGDQDVVGFRYGEYPSTYIAADRPGGTASIQYVPTSSGLNRIAAQSVDAAGNTSLTGDYRFWVAANEPEVTCTAQSSYVGKPWQCAVKPRGAGGVTGYSYQLNNGPERTINADGPATITITPTDPETGFNTLSVRTKLTTGHATAPGNAYFFVDLGHPTAEMPADSPMMGTPVSIRLHATLPGSATFTYRLDLGDWETVPVVDGTAVVTVTPAESGWHSLYVYTTTSDGQRSGTTQPGMNVASNGPRISSAEYPEGQYSGGVGVAGTFVFTSPVAGDIDSYEYSINDGEATTVPANADGTASMVFTPTRSYYWHRLTVTTVFADGTKSEPRTYTFNVNG
ncbi:hypothetical protein SAMN05421504_1011170 [Amycolatopsis xylanica]|uniref:Fibronectin type-III domain-containing protein n=1 Tax=Amycolatopsis xylanica TaxID=589385 RepID=A0A1H2VBC2_9PSEU|nr:hypothetical protein [Amycolatopsis xylanica]SDW65646.1 hypothetical protein SAMN05421504_1011170 [Amycolatopsis xylanica]